MTIAEMNPGERPPDNSEIGLGPRGSGHSLGRTFGCGQAERPTCGVCSQVRRSDTGCRAGVPQLLTENLLVEAVRALGLLTAESVLSHAPRGPGPDPQPVGLASLPVLRTTSTDTKNQTKERCGFQGDSAEGTNERT